MMEVVYMVLVTVCCCKWSLLACQIVVFQSVHRPTPPQDHQLELFPEVVEASRVLVGVGTV